MSKKISVFLIFVIFFSPHFWHPMGMTAPLAFAYTAYAQGRLWANHWYIETFFMLWLYVTYNAVLMLLLGLITKDTWLMFVKHCILA